MAITTLMGPVRSLNAETDGQIFIPAADFEFEGGTWTFTRNAAGNYFVRKTASVTTRFPSANLTRALLKKIGNDPQLLGPKPGPRLDENRDPRLRGVRVTSFDVVYAIGTAALTGHSADLIRSTYANNTAVVTDATVGGTLTGALATATQTNPYVTHITVGTPLVVGGNLPAVTDWLELTVQSAATSIYDLYGVFVDFDYNLL